jgi:OmpA-OmpF porin, OOP family
VLFPAVRLQFEFDGDDLLGHADPTLDAIGDIVSRYGWLRLEIAGHTDNVGADAYNLRLSERRANAVRDYLLSNFDIEGERLVARGYGSSRPLLPNRTHTERAVNRRVEFHVLEPLEPPQEEVEIDEDELIQTLEEAIREAMREGLQRPDEPRLEW